MKLKKFTSIKTEEGSEDEEKSVLVNSSQKYFNNLKMKHWRLIIRNLPFQTVVEDLEKICRKFGQCAEIVLPKCKDKRFPQSCAGFAFVQFARKKDAENIKGRKIIVDWAVPKDTYETFILRKKNWRGISLKSSLEFFLLIVSICRNLSFDVTDEQLRKSLEKYGEINLAIVCRYEESSHSKGSGFVHFKTKEQADFCIEENGIMIGDRKAFCYRALSKSDAEKIEKERKEKKPNDKRNLHLLRVSLVRPGTRAACGMSEADAQKRAKLANLSRQKLRNLHMFVSPTRLVVHNLPKSLDDKKLKSICFLAAGNPDAVISECRIWRDKNKLDSNGVPQSCGFGFVAFSEHSDALAALKSLNNNPETFTKEKRPIVEFSIENLAALRLRALRQNKSQKKYDKLSDKTKMDLEQTKKQIALGGRKPFPSHFGPKIRSRHLNVKQRKKNNTSVCLFFLFLHFLKEIY
ncbi:unnamed protein product [Dracunculus medinensis]|uniref:RNA-binding protein 28 n=1 Tax=Dracunculus medinensis TaxID=318479 RepID=A0A0N4U309_DRAME|nr:unnamed protein product [Dracunculus medinensis]